MRMKNDLRLVAPQSLEHRQILDAAGEGIWAVSESGLIAYVNRRGSEMLGYTAGEMLNQPRCAFVLPEDLRGEPRRTERGAQAAASGGECRIRCKDGSERWFRTTSRLVAGAAGEPIGAVEVFVDVTESRKVAGDLAQTARELRDLYEAAPCGYHSLDPDGIVIRINATELGWLGYARDEVVGKMHFCDFLLSRYHEQFRCNFSLLKRFEGVRDSEYEMRRKDGATFPILLSTVPLKGPRGEFLRTQGSVFDLSERKRAQAELEEAELRNTAILQAALDCIVSVDGSGKIIEFNPAAEKTFGYARADALGKDISALIVGAAWATGDAAHGGGADAEDRASTFGTRKQVQARRRDGAQFAAELAVTRVFLRDQMILTAHLRDITSEQRAEQALHRYAEGLRAVSRRLVEVQEAERRALASGLHDLVGQKLTALSINLNIVKSQLPSAVAAHAGARLDDSLKLVEETIESIRDVMTELRPAVLDDYGLVPVLRWYAEQFASRTGVAMSVVGEEPARRLPPAVEEALYRIVQEALANVAKYAKAHKAVVTLTATSQGTWLAISDDGCGFDLAAERSPDAHHGWGLMLMRERAAAVGAELSVQSARGCGTQIIVKLRGQPS